MGKNIKNKENLKEMPPEVNLAMQRVSNFLNLNVGDLLAMSDLFNCLSSKDINIFVTNNKLILSKRKELQSHIKGLRIVSAEEFTL